MGQHLYLQRQLTAHPPGNKDATSLPAFLDQHTTEHEPHFRCQADPNGIKAQLVGGDLIDLVTAYHQKQMHLCRGPGPKIFLWPATR